VAISGSACASGAFKSVAMVLFYDTFSRFSCEADFGFLPRRRMPLHQIHSPDSFNYFCELKSHSIRIFMPYSAGLQLALWRE